MIIRDSMAKDTTFEATSGSIDIIADDGRKLFSIALFDDGGIRVSSSDICRHDRLLLDETFVVHPRASNSIIIQRVLIK